MPARAFPGPRFQDRRRLREIEPHQPLNTLPVALALPVLLVLLALLVLLVFLVILVEPALRLQLRGLP